MKTVVVVWLPGSVDRGIRGPCRELGKRHMGFVRCVPTKEKRPVAEYVHSVSSVCRRT